MPAEKTKIIENLLAQSINRVTNHRPLQYTRLCLSRVVRQGDTSRPTGAKATPFLLAAMGSPAMGSPRVGAGCGGGKGGGGGGGGASGGGCGAARQCTCCNGCCAGKGSIDSKQLRSPLKRDRKPSSEVVGGAGELTNKSPMKKSKPATPKPAGPPPGVENSTTSMCDLFAATAAVLSVNTQDEFSKTSCWEGW